MTRIEDTWRLVRERAAVEGLPRHLEQAYGIVVATLTPLDAGVYRVDRRDGPPWVARLFPAARPFARAEGDADILHFLDARGFRAERLAHPEPLSTHAEQAVLVTEFIEGSPLSDPGETTFRGLGEMLGRLHTLPDAAGIGAPKAGAIHVLSPGEGGLDDEVAEAMSWLEEADVPAAHRGLYDSMRERVSRIDFGENLPQALLHPDPVLKNFIATPDGDVVPIDWTGAGRGPRAHPLAFLLLSAVRAGRWNPNSGKVDAVIDGYRRHVRLEGEECTALASAMPLHVLVHDCAAFCLGRTTFDDVAGGYSVICRLAATVAERVRRA